MKILLNMLLLNKNCCCHSKNIPKVGSVADSLKSAVCRQRWSRNLSL